MKGKCALMLGGSALIIGGILQHITVGVGFLCAFLMFCGAALMGYGLLCLPAVTRRWPKITRALRGAFYGGCILFLASFTLVEGVIISQRETQPYDGNYLIVLGAGLYGTEPSPALVSRMETAWAYLEVHPEAIAILSGGQGAGEDITEAEAMRRYFHERGVAPQRLYLEGASTNTRENLYNSKLLLEQMGVGLAQTEVAVITNGFHQYRAQSLARQAGLKTVALSADLPAVPGLALSLYVREYFAVGKFYLQALFECRTCAAWNISLQFNVKNSINIVSRYA